MIAPMKPAAPNSTALPTVAFDVAAGLDEVAAALVLVVEGVVLLAAGDEIAVLVGMMAVVEGLAGVDAVPEVAGVEAPPALELGSLPTQLVSVPA